MDAFLQIRTPLDFRDAVHLLMLGHNVAFEPVPGILTGLFRAPAITTGTGPLKKAENVTIIDDPASIADAAYRLLTAKHEFDKLRLIVEHGPRPDLLTTAFAGFAACLSHRCYRWFSTTDIVDLVSWFMPLTSAQADAQLPFGHDDYGRFVRRETVDYDMGWTTPDRSLISRSLVFWEDPEPIDLEQVLSCGPIGIIRAKGFARKYPWAVGTNVAKTMIMGAYTSGEIVTAASADDLRQASADAWHRAGEPLPDGLQSIWNEQRVRMRLYRVVLDHVEVDADRDLREAVFESCYDTADPNGGFRTVPVHPQPEGAITVSPGDLLERWESFVGAQVSSS